MKLNIYKTAAAACLAVSLGFSSVLGAELLLGVIEAPEEGYKAVDYCRRGKIGLPMKELKKNETAVQDLRTTFEGLLLTSPQTCADFYVNFKTMAGFYILLDYTEKKDEHTPIDFFDLMQEALDTGLPVFG
ncbi:hypothetical protein EAH_00064490 [Eimeria acervulina]|uniref:SAG family member n=1 Tax=Eimeria acervulina TaxID=5801 RepID=U6GFV5_EIMAC|nr:hypothetical protein EAH_00064490 [Eimeria acervulina]CDI77469.1 hypothetical protein EAH_00064490 [Eimeria acervulina]